MPIHHIKINANIDIEFDINSSSFQEARALALQLVKERICQEFTWGDEITHLVLVPYHGIFSDKLDHHKARIHFTE